MYNQGAGRENPGTPRRTKQRLWLAAAGAAFGLLNAPTSQAQSPVAPPSPISYVASIKPNNSPEARTVFDYSPQSGRFSAIAVTLRPLVRIAYRIQDYQLVGAPGWLSTRRYDMSAKVGTPPTNQVFLQALLADRFKLEVHKETREQPRFALVPARRDNRLGPQLMKSDFDCAAYAAAPHAPPERGPTPPCATRSSVGSVSGRSISINQLAPILAAFAGRFVMDKTGLTGGFDVELTWTPEPASPIIAGKPSPDAAPGDSAGPSLFTALQEQLGLRLVAERGPVDVLVVDHVDEASQN